YNVLGVKAADGGSGGPGVRAQSRGVAGERIDPGGEPTNLRSFVTGGARGEGGTDFTGSFGTALTVTPCASSGSQRWNTAMSDRSRPRTSWTRSTTGAGIAVTKACPATAAPNSFFTCTFSVQNLDPGNNVLSLSVKN